MNHPLLTLTRQNLTYLSKLDYVDLKNLCDTSTEFATICEDNTLLRSIIASKNPNIIISKDFDISGALNDIYDEIELLVANNFPDHIIPDWVNKEKFYNYMTRKLSQIFVERLASKISENADMLTFLDNFIEINKSFIALPFHSINFDLFDDDNEILESDNFVDVSNMIELPESFERYIEPTVYKMRLTIVRTFKNPKNPEVLENVSYHKINYEEMLNALHALFFVK